MASENNRIKLSPTTKVTEPNSPTNFTTASLASAIHRMMQDPELADFTVTCDDKEWKVHSALLAVRSPFFKAAITTNMTEKGEMKMDIKDFDPEAMEEVLNFMYGIPKGKTPVKFLFEAAERFQMDDLKEYAVKIARKEMTETNVVELAHLAETYGIEGFFGECAKFIVKNDVPLKEEDMSSKLAVKVVAILKSANQKLKGKVKAESCDWGRLHNIHIQYHGQLLEFHCQKSIRSAGTAQAKKPLSTSNNYFEIEIIDSEADDYITIGLTRKDYSKNKYPGLVGLGLEKGGIGYHTDDGKVYTGSFLTGEKVELCKKGDIMGCGILFSSDYESKSDSEDEQESQADLGENEDGVSEEDKDDQDVNTYDGQKIHVYFSKNGKLMWMKETVLPKGGFFPTVGMMNSEEKVRVNLKPNVNPIRPIQIA